jgi:hypothetical protein
MGDELAGLKVIQHDDTNRFKFFRISSKERTSGTPSSWNVNFQNDSRFDKVVEVHLVSISFCNCFPNVSAAKGNNTFEAVGTVAGAISFTVPDGFYTTTTLMAEIQTQLNAAIAPSTVAITQDGTTNRITFTITGAETIAYENVASGSTISDALGIINNSAALGTFTADAVPNLNGETMLYVHSPDLAQNLTYLSSATGVNDVNGMFSVPITVPVGAYQSYQPDEQDRIVYGRHGRSLRNFRITLRGNGGRQLTEMPDNHETVIVLKMLWEPSI